MDFSLFNLFSLYIVSFLSSLSQELLVFYCFKTCNWQHPQQHHRPSPPPADYLIQGRHSSMVPTQIRPMMYWSSINKHTSNIEYTLTCNVQERASTLCIKTTTTIDASGVWWDALSLPRKLTSSCDARSASPKRA